MMKENVSIIERNYETTKDVSVDSMMIINDGVLCSFSGNVDLLLIPEGVVKIDAWAFKTGSFAAKIIMPSSLREIGDYAFISAKIYQVVLNDGIYKIGKQAFLHSTIMDINLPNSLKFIGDFAFSCCSELAKIDIPASVVRLGNSCFSGCISLSEVTIEEKVYCNRPYLLYDSNIFYSTAIQKIDIPEDVRFLGEGTFGNCKELNNIQLHPKITVRGNLL